MQNQNDFNDGELDLTELIQTLGIANSPQEEQETVLGDILDAVNLRVMKRIMDSLNEEQRHQVRDAINANPGETQAAILNTVPREQQVHLYQEEIDIITEELQDEAEQDQGGSDPTQNSNYPETQE